MPQMQYSKTTTHQMCAKLDFPPVSSAIIWARQVCTMFQIQCYTYCTHYISLSVVRLTASFRHTSSEWRLSWARVGRTTWRDRSSSKMEKPSGQSLTPNSSLRTGRRGWSLASRLSREESSTLSALVLVLGPF